MQRQLTARERYDLAERARREHWARKQAQAELDTAITSPVARLIDMLQKEF